MADTPTPEPTTESTPDTNTLRPDVEQGSTEPFASVPTDLTVEVDTMSASRPDVERGSTEPFDTVPREVVAPEVVTLAQPVPVQRLDITQGPTIVPELHWYDGTTVVAEGDTPPDTGGGGTPATGADAGAPGAFTPSGCDTPADLAALQGGNVTANPATAWTTGQHVVLGDASHAYWDATAWQGGDAP